jgi:hypothetical protein
VSGALRRPADPAPWPWLGLASCALAVAGATIFILGSTLSFQGSYGEEAGKQNVGVNFSFGSELGAGGMAGTAACFVAGAALGALALHRERRSRVVAAVALALNGLFGGLLVAFVVAGYVQGG